MNRLTDERANTSRRASQVLLLCALALSLIGMHHVGSSDNGASTQEPPTSTSSAQAGHNDQDIAFAQGMIPHHQQAVDMAEMAAEKAANPQVKDLASRIEGAQDPEIQPLTETLGQWDTPVEPPTSSMPGMDHGDMSGDGMMTNEDMRQLEQATGADFDRLLESGENADAKALAQKISDAQEAKISEMQGMSL